ncbi:hypothetical protein [Allosphingosinicella vermicomposti]|uniref:hypothetical protein n=1 Tax=Allosphingosinicella vermicomposti TaxID=614671 RepID=UPI00131A5367|nr:hypothetical protein [Allosphingosinicella vermicomposti]
MSNDNSGWPDYPLAPTQPNTELAPLAPLADGEVVGRDARGRFISGNIGGGRRKGSRNRLTETFIAAIECDFAEHGPDALAKLRADDPAAYLRIVASLVPRDLILKREQAEDYSGLSIGELEEILERERHNGMVAKLVQQARRGY